MTTQTLPLDRPTYMRNVLTANIAFCVTFAFIADAVLVFAVLEWWGLRR
jgi:hypothetical protein